MLRILVVDDNPADAQILTTALEKTALPIEITVLADGKKALEYLSEGNVPPRCDLLLLDLNLPGLSGFEVLERIRACVPLAGLPVVVMSGSSSAIDVERCYQAGANSYICKPSHLQGVLTSAAQFVTYWSQCVILPSSQRSLNGYPKPL